MSLLAQLSGFGQAVSPILSGLSAVTGSQKLAKASQVSAALSGQNVMPGAGMQKAAMLPLAPVIRSLPTIGRETARAGAAGAAALGLSGLFGGTKKRRRMNPLNVKAARRAIRRINAVRKITRDIEKQLPTRTVRSRAAPAGHRARLSHK